MATTTEIWTASPTADSCLAVEVEVVKDLTDADKLSVALAFVIGAIVGVLLLILCAKLCLKDCAKKKYQDAEAGYHEKTRISKVKKKSQKDTETVPIKKKKKGFLNRKKLGLKKGKKPSQDDGPLLVVNPVTLDDLEHAEVQYIDRDGAEVVDPNQGRGLADAMMQTTGSGVDAEISEQDLNALTDLERQLREESIMTMMQLLRAMLNAQLKKGKLTEEQCKELMRSTQEDIEDAVKTAQREKQEKEEELKQKIRDPVKLQEAMDKLHPQYMHRLNVELHAAKEKMRQRLARKTDLTESEVEALMAQNAENMALLESLMGQERARAAAALEERLARRKQLTDVQLNEHEQQYNELDFCQDVTSATLMDLVESNKLTDRQKEEIMRQYEEDLYRVQMKHEEELQRQKLSLAEKLRRNRAEQIKKLEQQQEEERGDFLNRSDKYTDTRDLVESYHAILQHQHQQSEDLCEELDHEEAEEFHRLNQSLSRRRDEQLDEVQLKVRESLEKTGHLSGHDVDRIMRRHQQEMEEFERMRKSKRKRAKAILEEKLAQRRQMLDEEHIQAVAEQKAVREQQDMTLQKVLGSQLEITNDAKKKILREHEQNMGAINNNLQMSRLRQQKRLEQKLNARKAKLAELKQKSEETRRTKQDLKPKDREKLDKELQKQIAEEEKKLEEEKVTAMLDFRQDIAAETRASLEEQERQMGLLIARLQVGQARRQALIQRQDKTIKELEEKVAHRVAEKESREPQRARQVDQHVDQLLQDHYQQVSHLTDKMAETRDRQEQLLQEKIQAKKLRRERTLEDTLDNEAQEEWQQQRKRGAGLASSLLGQAMMESRHRKAMQQLEKEMHQEMMKQREELNRELEEDLERELEDQRKSFLAQIAAVTNMSKDEVTDLVETAVADSGGGDKEAKRLAKELRLEVKRAKTELDLEPEPPTRSLRRARTDIDEDDAAPRRPSTGKRRPRSAFKGDYDDDRLYS